MKSIKNKETNIISRVKDIIAHEKVREGNWGYTNKTEWKKTRGRATKDVPEVVSSDTKPKRGKKSNRFSEYKK